MRFKLQYKLTILFLIALSIFLAGIDLYLKKISTHTPNLGDPGLNRIFIFAVFFGLIVACISGYFASRWMVQPLKLMADNIRNITAEHYSSVLLEDRQDEIGELARSLNAMSEHIKMRIEDVHSSKSRLEAVFLSMFEGILVIDSQGTILLMNQTLKNLLYVTEEPIGRKLLAVIRNIDVLETAEKVLKIKSGVESRELSVLLPEEKVLRVNATPIIREGRTDGAIMVFHDITQLRHLEKVRQDFVANVSHELRTPVSTIKGYAETLLEGALEDKENARDFIQIIHTDADRLAKLVNDLLDLSRIESGKINLRFVPCQLEPVLDRVIVALQKIAQEKSIIVTKDFPKDLAMVEVDETAIAQVFLNLLENAIKYNVFDGKVHISARELEGFVEVSIIDTGIGIPEEDLNRIFERFYRVDKARSRELGGTGLGLSIVKHIVAAHGGEISAQSELDKGSTFRLTLPGA